MESALSALAGIRRILYGLGIERFVRRTPGARKLYLFLYRRSRPQGTAIANLRDYGFRMCLDPRDKYVAPMMMTLGRYDPLGSKVFASLLKEGMMVVDIGAHAGYYTLLAATRVGRSGKVFSFEPAPGNFDLLLQNISLNGLSNVLPQRKAILDRAGTCRFFLAAENLGHHGIYTKKDSEEAEPKEIEVEAASLDELFPSADQKIDLIKMDVEGAEPLALKGMRQVISRSERLGLLIEFCLHNLRLGGHSPDALLSDLAAHSFVIHLLDEYSKRARKIEARELMEICTADPDEGKNLLCLKNMELQPSIRP